MSSKQEAIKICRKWVSKMGLGFHPDTLAMHYDPPMNYEDQMEYTLDMMMLFMMQDEDGIDPYEVGIEAMEEAKLI